MGFWKDVAYDIARGMSEQTAIEVNAILRDKNTSEVDKMRASARAEAEVKLNSTR